MDEPPSTSLKRCDLVALAAVAAAARVFNLGTFSLWLDEILLVLRAQGTLAETWAACRANAEHPPLSALAMNLLYDLGAGDTLQRLLPIALGIATVLLIAAWTARHFGRAAGFFTGLVMALTATQVRYAQELRPYAYLLFFVALALAAADRYGERRRPRDLLVLAAVLAAGLYSHYLAALTPVVLAVPLLPRLLARERAERRSGARALLHLIAATALAVLAFAPWLATIATVAGRPAKGGTAHWTLAGAASRWEVVTVGMRDGDPLTWAGVVTALLALLGLVRAARSGAGWVVISGALLGTVGVELMLLRAHHWSNARYDLFGGLYLCILVGLGAGWLASLRPRPLPAVAAVAVLVAVSADGLARYAAFGRPTWDRVATAVKAFRLPGERIFTENEWSRISLAYYLQGRDFEQRRGDGLAPLALRSHMERLAEGWPPAACALLVAAGNPLYPPLEARLPRFPLLGHFPSTDEARVYLLTPEVRQQVFASGWPEIGPADLSPAACRSTRRLLPAALRVPPLSPWARLLRRFGLADDPAAHETLRLDFDRASTAHALVHGWSGFEKVRHSGTTYAWAVGREAVLALRCDAPRARLIRLVVRAGPSPAEPQRFEAFLNDVPIGTATLGDAFQTVWLETETEPWLVGENLLTLRFAHAISPKQVDPRLTDTRPLAAAFDWVELMERSL